MGWKVTADQIPLLWRYERVRLAERFGQPMEYFDGLPYRAILDIYGVLDAEAKVRELKAEEAKRKAAAKGRGRRRR